MYLLDQLNIAVYCMVVTSLSAYILNIGDDKRSFYKTARKRFWEGTCDFLFIGKSAKVSSACCVEFYF